MKSFILLLFVINTLKIVEIRRGYTLKKISLILKKYDVIKDPYIFIFLSKITGNEKKIKSGKYILPEHLGEFRALIWLVKGKGRITQIKVTIPEGLASFEIARILYQKCGVDTIEFMQKVNDTIFIKKFSKKYKILDGINSLEGFLFPSTYYFYYDAPPEEIIEVMVEEFFKNFDSLWIKKSKELGYTFYDVLKIASLVEKEAIVEREKPVIASVFYNRLKKGYFLQSNVTILYVLRKHKAWLSEEDLNIESPYNTYKYKGLPPTPICNPSISSIKAALNPAKTNYLYFVTKWDGTHFFAKTFKEHIRNKLRSRKILRKMKEKK